MVPERGGNVTGPESASIGWQKSSASGGVNGDCVEVAFVGDSVLVRHSHNPTGPVLTFTHSEWRAFLTGMHNGEFDLAEA